MPLQVLDEDTADVAVFWGHHWPGAEEDDVGVDFGEVDVMGELGGEDGHLS